MQNMTTTEVSATLAVHVKLWLAVAVERAPVLLACNLSIVANRVGLVRLVERLEPKEIDAPVQEAADGGLPIGLHVIVACFGSAGIGAACAWPAGFCEREY